MITIQKQGRENILASLLMLMLTGLFISRALLGISMTAFCAAAFLLRNPPSPKNHNASFLLTGLAFMLLMPVLSGFWSSDTAYWQSRCLVKLPLLLLPLAFYFYRPQPFTVFAVSLVFVLFVTCGTLYSIYEYFLGSDEIEQGYLAAKVMPTIPGNDHIRFSWMVVIAGLLLLYLLKDINRRSFRIFSIALLSWLVIFLHILAAKTGLLLFYLAAIILLIHHLIRKKKKKWLLLLLLLPLVPFTAYHTIPTFKKRMQYALYDYQHYSQNSYREGLSDGMRIISIKAGLDIWKQHAVAGTGYGDIRNDAKKWYEEAYPQVQPYEQILPSSQFLLYASGAGVIGLFFFIAGLTLPLTRRELLHNPYYTSFYLPAIASFIFEIHLESQYGCFIFCFFACWMGLAATRIKSEP